MCVIVIDEAQNLSWELLEEIRLLTNLETSSEKLLQIVLSGQPELQKSFAIPVFANFVSAFPCGAKHLRLPARRQRRTSLKDCALPAQRGRAFTPEAIQVIHRYSRGIPRVINLICEHAMINAYVEQIKPIPPRIIESVSRELDLDLQPFLIPPLLLRV